MSNISPSFSAPTLLATSSSFRHFFPLGSTKKAKPVLPSTRPEPPMHRIDITHFINFKLDLAANNYAEWTRKFYAILAKYDCAHHVDHESDPRLQDAKWRNDDLTIVLWFYATICDELYQVVREPENTAYTVWDKLYTFFRDNQPGWAIHIREELSATEQGDMTVAAYCNRIKALADALDASEPVSDDMWTLQMIRGLNNRFHVLATTLPMHRPFPTFIQARSMLLLEEINLNARDRAKGSSTITIGTNTGSNSTPGRSNNGNQGDRNAFSNTWPGQSAQPQQRPWMGYFAPWGAPFPLLRQPPHTQRAPQNARGVLNPRPSAPTQGYSLLNSMASIFMPSPLSRDQFSVIDRAPGNTSSTPPPTMTSTWTMPLIACDGLQSHQGNHREI
ncbi:unnamed protein product [Triticum turgidum subsp. durum]|uniref:Uncharacterized protein n=1 Tax=Triticum turgidum subsp. durum TaxID=4567 RepID=A0A9R0S2F4_TRITD|nr:unnamed protein product [Triticum turgidum subsp. durum]